MQLAQINFKTLEKVTSADANNIGDIVSRVFEYATVAGGLLLLLYILLGGFKWMTSQGDPKKIQEARAVITNGLVGFLIIFTAFWIVQIIATILGLETILGIF